LAVSAASEHAVPGTADVTLHVHLRREDVEPVVLELAASKDKDGGYRSVTASTSIGYLMPEATWRSWPVSSDNASSVAAELASLAQQYAQPFLQRLASDPDVLLESVKSSIRMAQATGPCAVAVLLTRLGRPGEGRSFTQGAVAALGDRADPHAMHLRETAERFDAWQHFNASRP
jgi:hypothetical protein